MLKLTVLAVVLAVASSSGLRRTFVKQCSLSDPNIDQCFVKNANFAITELKEGIPELDLANLNGFDFGDVFVSLQKENVSFLLEDIKGYQRGITVDKAHLHFDTSKSLRHIEITFAVFDAVWFAKYRAVGTVSSHMVNERGDIQIDFGNVTINSTLDFKRKDVGGVYYLKARRDEGTGTHEKFEVVPRNAKGDGLPLGPEQFQQLEYFTVKKARDVILEYITFAFNQILQEIPADQIFLP